MKKLLLLSAVLLSNPASAADLNLGIQSQMAGDYTTAAANYQPLALGGNAEAAYRMCGMYYLGQGVPKSDTEAVSFCKMAASHGHVEAMYNLGLFYQQGTGTRQDPAEAARWYAAASSQGHPDARYNLSQLQARGVTTPANGSYTTGSTTPSVPVAAAAPAPLVAQNIPQAAPVPVLPPPQIFPAGTDEKIIQAAQERTNQQIASLPAPAAMPAAPVAPIAPTMPTYPMQVANVAAPVARIAAPSAPPAPPVPPIVRKTEVVQQAEEDPQELEIAKYCLMAAQRGHPDPGCEKEFAGVIPPVAPKPVQPVAAQTAAVAAAPVATTKAIVEVPTQTLAPPPGFLDAPKAIALPVDHATQNDASYTIANLVVNTNSPSRGVNVMPNHSAEAAVAALPPLAGVSAVGVMQPQAEPQVAAVSTTASQPQTEQQKQDLKWYVEQANSGSPQAQNNLGVMYRRGLNGLNKNMKESITWFERSASKGSTNAMLNLASIYRDGEGTPQNLELAYAWYNLAADRLPNNDKKKNASENVQQIAKYLNNQQIGNALQYVTKLDDTIPVLDESK